MADYTADLNPWALSIGHLVLSMNSLDYMLNNCYRALTDAEPSNNWTKMALGPRMKSLIEKLPYDSQAQTKLREVLAEARELIKCRNIVSHAWVAVDACGTMKPGEPTKWLLFARGHADPLTLDELFAAAKKCRDLSDRISEAIAMLGFNKAHQARLAKRGSEKE